MQGPAKEIGLLVINDELIGDLAALSQNSNLTITLELSQDTDAQEVIDVMSEALAAGKLVLLRLHDYLDPKIYNQLWLLAKKGQLEYPLLDQRVVVPASPAAALVIVSTDEELERLNYDNIFDLVGLTERL